MNNINKNKYNDTGCKNSRTFSFREFMPHRRKSRSDGLSSCAMVYMHISCSYKIHCLNLYIIFVRLYVTYSFYVVNIVSNQLRYILYIRRLMNTEFVHSVMFASLGRERVICQPPRGYP